MKNHEEVGGNAENDRGGFDEVADEVKKESWADHLRKAKQLVKEKISRGKAKSGETDARSGSYLLSEHMEPYGRTRKDQKYWRDIYRGWDECGIEIPEELGEMVEGYVKSPDYMFGVHRSYAIEGANYESDEILQSIMREGLINMGDASSGAIRKDPAVGKTVAFCQDMLSAVIHLKGSYKGSTGVVLVAIPSEYIANIDGYVEDGMIDKVYNHNESGYSLLKPEFILGFAKNLGKGSTLEFKTREELLAGYETAKGGSEAGENE